MKNIILLSIIGLILIGSFGCKYMKENNLDKPNFEERRDMQMNEETKNKTISFFEHTTNLDEIKTYCEENRMNCAYYCREINSEHEICETLPKQGERPFNQNQ